MASRGHSEPHLAAAGTPAGPQQAQQQQQQASATPHAHAEDAGVEGDSSSSSSSSSSVDPEELKRREVLSKLQGPDTQLESGLKVRC
jgi:hypothetical protein